MLEPGCCPSRFLLTRGESVAIRVIAIGMEQRERVGRSVERLEGDAGPGRVYRFTADGRPGQIRHVVMSLVFPEKHDPPAKYLVQVESAGVARGFEAPTAFQPPVGVFPQRVPYALSFVIT